MATRKRVFASRTIDLDGGRGGRLELRVYAPRKVDRAYECDFTLTHDGIRIGGHPTLGEDAVQALLLALGLASVEVEIAVERRRASVDSWLLADLRDLAREQARTLKRERRRPEAAEGQSSRKRRSK